MPHNVTILQVIHGKVTDARRGIYNHPVITLFLVVDGKDHTITSQLPAEAILPEAVDVTTAIFVNTLVAQIMENGL